MDTTRNPFFTAPFANPILPATLSTAIDPVFNSKFHLQNCSGAEVVAQLFAHFQRTALHISHPLVHARPQGTPTLIFPEPKASAAMLTTRERESTLVGLSVIVNNLDIVVAPLPRGNPGRTTARPERRFVNRPGCGSTITISLERVQDLNAAVAAGDIMLQQYFQFDLARILVHEFAHVISFAVLPPASDGQCFLGDARTTEIGFEFESRVFGGIIGWEYGNTYSLDGQRIPFTLSQYEWVHVHTLDTYNSNPDPNGARIATRGGHFSRVMRKWQVNFDWIAGMFHDAFWRDVYRHRVGTHMVRQIGILGTALANNRMAMADPSDLDAAVEHVPAGFVFENGCLRRA